MNPQSPGTGEKRKDFLRGVYEDNLKIVNKPAVSAPRRLRPLRQPPPPGQPLRSRRSLWGLRVGWLLAGVLVMLGGFQAYREIQARQRGQADGRDLAERIAQEFGGPADPGLAREVPIANLFGLQVKTIVIDPGHGGKDPGAIGPTGLREKDVTLDVARRLQRRLERDYGYEILMTRQDDRKVSLRQRVAFANDHDADLFISIHVNALPVDTVTSVETYYFSPQADAQTLQLAELENKDSEYSMAEFQHTFEKMTHTMKFQESKQLAGSIQRVLYRNMRRVNGEVSDWGAKSGPFVVLLGVEVPSVLAEISVISNSAEEAKLNTPEHREQLAMFLAAGIVGYLNPETSESTEGATEYGTEKDDD